jgi:hypothetical protein
MDVVYMELAGELTGIGLRPLLNFLSDLGKSGRLVVRDDWWTGTIGLLDGQIVGANFANEEGLAALDAIFVILQRGSFEFNTSADCAHNVLVQPLPLAEHIDALDAEVQQLAELVSSLSAVPGLTESIPDGEITLTRSSLALLLALDGRRTVADHARERGLLPTLRRLSELIRLGLVGIQTPAPGFDAMARPLQATETDAFGATPSSNATRTDGAPVAPPRLTFRRRA